MRVPDIRNSMSSGWAAMAMAVFMGRSSKFQVQSSRFESGKAHVQLGVAKVKLVPLRAGQFAENVVRLTTGIGAEAFHSFLQAAQPLLRADGLREYDVLRD